MLSHPFRQIIASRTALQEIVGKPSQLSLCKQNARLDHHCRSFIACSSFLLVATADQAGRCDVSPRGDAPGFVLVLNDKTLVIPDRPGNRRIDTLSNIVENPHAGLLFIIPGFEETLRVNGSAAVVRDDEVLERMSVKGKRPLVGIAVEVQECYLHCARSFKRAGLWDTGNWLERSELPSLAQMLLDQVPSMDYTLDELERVIEDAYTHLDE